MIYTGDCCDVMKTLPENSVDAMVTDPPYGWRFMGSAWDKFDIDSSTKTNAEMRPPRTDGRTVPRDSQASYAGIYDQSLSANLAFQAWTTEWAREAYRILKPGAHILVFCGPRTYHRMASGVEDAGFEVRDQMQWLFGSGFPKNLDISKQLDKMAGAERDVTGPQLRPDGSFRTNTAKRDGSSFASGSNDKLGTAPSTPEAKQWQGFGTALKPANEPILLARKPLSEKTVAANCLKWGCGGLNIDASRVGLQTGEVKHGSDKASPADGTMGRFKDERTAGPNVISTKGRFPANLVFSHNPDCVEVGVKKVKRITGGITGNLGYHGADGSNPGVNAGGLGDADGTETVAAWICSDGCAVAMLDEQSGVSKSTGGSGGSSKAFNLTNGDRINSANVGGLGDSGGASRFFKSFHDNPTRFMYCAKASKAEKNAGCEGLPAANTRVIGKKHLRCLECGCERINSGGLTCGHTNTEWVDNSDDKGNNNLGGGNTNHHPTIKPLRLMTYLIRLISPPGGIVLDPFMGSGSTGVAAEREGFQFIGIEKEAEYVAIAEKRISENRKLKQDNEGNKMKGQTHE